MRLSVNPFVARLHHLTDLDGNSLFALAHLCERVRVIEPRTVVAPAGQSSEDLHVVLDGWACQYKLMSDKRRHVPAFVLPGDLADLDRLILPKLDYGLATVSACTVAALPRAGLQALLKADPALREVFDWLRAVENAQALEHQLSLGRRSAPERLAHLFCTLHARLRATLDGGEDLRFECPLTQDELADATGLSVVHVNRTLQVLRSEGLIALETRRLTILDWQGLARRADFDSAFLHAEGVRVAAQPSASP